VSERIRVGVVGGGLVGQASHLHYLAHLRERFELAALAEPSRSVRGRLQARFGIPHGYDDYRGLLDAGVVEAIVVASPVSTHATIVVDALDAGVDVFVEKPMCITLADADRIIEARDRVGKVVQVGYMKRHDPAFERLLEDLPGDASGLRYVHVLSHDPEWMPFFGVEDIVRGDDVPAELIEATRRAEADQVEEAVGSRSPEAVFAFSEAFLGSLVHQVNLVHGILQRLGEPLPARVVAGNWWAGGRCLNASVELSSGARWDSAWVQLLDLPEYVETITLLFANERVTLSFPSPWLKQSPTHYERSSGERAAWRLERLVSYEESFQRELVHFHECVTQGVECRTPPEQARLDIEVLTQMFLASR
jgi:predicted dehydrogenase